MSSTSSASTPAPIDAPSVDDLLVGKVLDGRYAIDGLIGEGGLGRVYRGRHLKLDRPVAIKVLLEEHRDLPSVRQRFEREARTLSALNHPNIVTITDFGVDTLDGDEVPYLVMELIEGRDLESVLTTQGALAPERAFDIARQLFKSLAYAHAQGVVHRDLKPGNILLRPLPDGSEHVEVLDFGLAKFFDEEPARGGEKGAKLTRVGTIVGTPAYMAPEQVEGGAVDARTDVYAATLVLFEMLTGRMAFDAPDASTLLRHHLITPPPTLRESMPGAQASAGLEAFVQKGLAKRADERFADGSEMLGALDEVSRRRAFQPSELPPPPRPPSGPTALFSRLSRTSLDDALAKMPEPMKEAIDRARDSAFVHRFVDRVRALPKWVAAAIGLVGVLIFALMVTWFASLFEAEPPPPALPMPEADTVLPILEDKPEARNPFEDEAIPDDLAPLHAKLSAGRRLSRREIGTLRSYAAANPNDPRPLLLHAHAYVAKGWLSEALPLYLQAYALDPTVRGDPRMLRGVVRMARSRKLEVEGANAVIGIYGDEAEEAVRQAIDEANRPDDRARLEALIQEL